MNSFNIPCPDCGASLKIADRAHIGKMTKCPKCRGLVRITPPDDEEFLSDFDSNEYEDLPYEPEPEPVRKKPKPKPKKRPARPASDASPAKKVGIAICVLIGVVLGFLSTNPNFNVGDALAWIGGPSGIAPDLTWLPDGLDSVGEVRVSQLVQTPVVTEALKKPEAIAGVAMMTGMLGFNLHDVDSVRFGLMATPTPDAMGKFSAVVRLLKPGRVAALLEASSGTIPPGATKTPHGSRLLYTVAALPTVSVCCIDDQTILIGTTNELKGVLDKEGKPESTTRFSIVDKPHQVMMVVAPSKTETASGFLGDGNLDLFRNTPTTALSFCADLDSSLHAAVTLKTKSSRNAQDAKADFERGLKNFEHSPLSVTVSPELQQALKSVNVTASGRMVTVTGEVPTTAIVSAIASQNGGLPGSAPPPLTAPGIELDPSIPAIPPTVSTANPVPESPASTSSASTTRPPRPGDTPQSAPVRRPSAF